MRRSFLGGPPSLRPLSPDLGDEESGRSTPTPPSSSTTSLLGRRTLAGMLSEALCSRARRVSERRPRSTTNSKFSCDPAELDVAALRDEEVPFARRAREQGRVFRGGKVDGELSFCLCLLCWLIRCCVDISVVVAVISPADVPRNTTQAQPMP